MAGTRAARAPPPAPSAPFHSRGRPLPRTGASRHRAARTHRPLTEASRAAAVGAAAVGAAAASQGITGGRGGGGGEAGARATPAPLGRRSRLSLPRRLGLPPRILRRQAAASPFRLSPLRRRRGEAGSEGPRCRGGGVASRTTPRPGRGCRRARRGERLRACSRLSERRKNLPAQPFFGCAEGFARPSVCPPPARRPLPP